MAAPIGNKFALGMGGGRPPVFDNAEQLAEKIGDFFEYVKGEFHEEDREVRRKDKETKEEITETIQVTVWDRPSEQPNITNLALFLGFESRQSFYAYGDKEEFSYTIKRARLAIENHYEDHLLTQAATGAIFALKNFGWEDRSKVEQTGKDGAPIQVERKVNYDELSDEQLEEIIARGSRKPQ